MENYQDDTYIPPCTGKYAVYCVLGTICFFLLAAVPCMLSAQITDYDLRKYSILTISDNEEFARFFYRGDTFYTTVFPLSGLFFYTVMLGAGFVFVNVVNLQCKRKSPFFDHHMNTASFWKTILVAAPAQFILSSMYMLRAKYDEFEYCQHPYEERPESSAQPFDETIKSLFAFILPLIKNVTGYEVPPLFDADFN